ncbi:hypothetical protein G7Y79_00048g083860 [Physcia stellaris]|nr:hypothetical protein G7Y79_00048g083860 [Physcia stellaris]
MSTNSTNRLSSYPTSHSTSSQQQQQQPQSASQISANRNRQYTHLHAQLAQLNAHMADTENLVRMTAVQADYVRGLGGWWGGAFMAASKILGEETVGGAGAGNAAKDGEEKGREES